MLAVLVYLLLIKKWDAPGSGVYGGEESAPPPALEGSDNSATINQELQGVDLGDLESEFQSIDSELNNL